MILLLSLIAVIVVVGLLAMFLRYDDNPPLSDDWQPRTTTRGRR